MDSVILEDFKKNKQNYCLSFYDKNDEFLLYLFDNERQILKFQGKELTTYNLSLIKREIERSIKSSNGKLRWLTGEKMVLHLIKIKYNRRQKK